MIAPRKVKFEAKKKENENIEFRTFLKCNADEKELDEQFKKLHEELFAKYDVKRGLRKRNGEGVLAGLTDISMNQCLYHDRP